jgi:hypothetical protein
MRLMPGSEAAFRLLRAIPGPRQWTVELAESGRPHGTLHPHRGATAQSRLVSYLLTLGGNRRLSQFVEQRLSLFKIGGIEAFGKPAVDRREQCHRLLLPALSSA